MTQNEYTKIILNIKDKNVYFYDNCLETRKINGDEVRIFHGYVTYVPDFCPICGCINNSYKDIIKWDFKKGCKIKMPKVSKYKTLLILDKQRFYCKNCNHTFTASTKVVDYHKQISNNTILSIKLDLMKKENEKTFLLKMMSQQIQLIEF